MSDSIQIQKSVDAVKTLLASHTEYDEAITQLIGSCNAINKALLGVDPSDTFPIVIDLAHDQKWLDLMKRQLEAIDKVAALGLRRNQTLLKAIEDVFPATQDS